MPVFYSEDFKNLEETLKYTFNDPSLLEEAITHRSFYHEYPGKSTRFNERLEFLGDAVLGLVISEALFRHDSSYNESEMSKLKSYLVSGETLSKLAADSELGRYLRLGKGEDQTGGRQKASLLANTLEAILGAVFIDSDYKTAKSVIIDMFSSIMSEVIFKDINFDFKTELQEASQNIFSQLPEYKLVGEIGDDHNKTFTYEVYLDKKKYGVGSGRNKKAAQTSAASMALKKLRDEETSLKE